VHDLVYYEIYDNINTAISREKEMKKWRRKDKINLIEKENSNWRDLYEELNPV
jgi:putative endonuclease